jgi:hypothetical protein
MGWFQRLDTPHERRQALEWIKARAGLLLGAVVGIATAIGLIAGGLGQLEALFGNDLGGMAPTAGSVATLPEARFALLVAKACDASNRGSHDEVRLAGKLQADLRRARSAVQAKGEVLRTIDALASEATDVESILASATPPPAERPDQRAAVAALRRNILRLRRYEQRLDLAVTPQQTYSVIQTSGAMVEAVASDRALTRSRLLAMGGGDCRLDPIPTPAPIFPPAIYAAPESGAVPVSSTTTGHATRATAKPKRNIAPVGRSGARRALKPTAKRRRTHRNASLRSSTRSPGEAPPDIPMPAPAPPPPVPPYPAKPPVTVPLGTSAVAEQETPTHAAETFTSYHEPYSYGPPISAGQWVEVSCQVYDPTDPRGVPGGFWYLLATAPWSNAYFAPARTFMNGDPENGPYTHSTDLAVPDCVPSSTG